MDPRASSQPASQLAWSARIIPSVRTAVRTLAQRIGSVVAQRRAVLCGLMVDDVCELGSSHTHTHAPSALIYSFRLCTCAHHGTYVGVRYCLLACASPPHCISTPSVRARHVTARFAARSERCEQNASDVERYTRSRQDNVALLLLMPLSLTRPRSSLPYTTLHPHFRATAPQCYRQRLNGSAVTGTKCFSLCQPHETLRGVLPLINVAIKLKGSRPPPGCRWLVGDVARRSLTNRCTAASIACQRCRYGVATTQIETPPPELACSTPADHHFTFQQTPPA